MSKDDRIFILCGDYGITNSFCQIFDKIWMNARGGHSFGVEKREKPEDLEGKSVGGFDGDGSAIVDWNILGVNGNVFENGNWKDLKLTTVAEKGSGKGDHLLIVKGSRDGIESLQNIFDNVMTELGKEDKEYGFVRIYTDDNENILLGSVYQDCDDGGDGFGFYVVLEDNPIFEDPIFLTQTLGLEIKFYRS